MLVLACFHGILSALICTHNNLHHVQILIIIDQCKMFIKKTKDSIEESHDLIKTKNAIKQHKKVIMNIKWQQVLTIGVLLFLLLSAPYNLRISLPLL